MRLYPYTLDAKDDCPAAFAAVLESGHLVCLFDGRPVALSIPTPRGKDIRLAAVEALRNRHRLNDAFVGEQEGYAARLTLAAVKSRLRMLVDRGTLSETGRDEEVRAIETKFGNLQTIHDWQRYLSVSMVAKAHLDRCIRMGGDFERYVAPRLANYIETDFHQEQAKVGLGMLEPRVPGTVTVCSRLAGFLQSVGWKPQAPSDVTQTAIEVLAWCDDMVKQRETLRAELDKRNATLQAALRYVPEAETLLRKELDRRGVPWDKADNVAVLTSSLASYLSDVERFAVKRWRDMAMRAIESLNSAAGAAGYSGVLSDMARVYRRNTTALLKRAGEMHREEVGKREATIVDLTAKIAGMEAQVELCLADDLQLKPTIDRLTAENAALSARLSTAVDKETHDSLVAEWSNALHDTKRKYQEEVRHANERLMGVTVNRDSYKRAYNELKAVTEHSASTIESERRAAAENHQRVRAQLEAATKARDEAQALAARLDSDLIASNLHLRKLLDEQGQAQQIVSNWSTAQADWKTREATLVERLRELEAQRDDLATRNTVLLDTNRRLVNQSSTPTPTQIVSVTIPEPAAPAPAPADAPRKVTMREVPKTALNARMAAQRVGLSLDRFRQLVHDRRGPRPTWRAGAGRGGALWYTPTDIDTWAAQRSAQQPS